MTQPKLVIWGASGWALVVANIVRQQGIFEIVGFLDSVYLERHGQPFGEGTTILGGQEQLNTLQAEGIRHIILGFGDCAARLEITDCVLTKGYELATAIHPISAIAPDVSIGAGVVVGAGAVINPRSTIGISAIVGAGATIGHECNVADGVYIAPGVNIAGNVTIGRGTWIGIGAVVKEKTRIGASSIIGAGAVVLHDIPDGVVAYGLPAKVIKPV